MILSRLGRRGTVFKPTPLLALIPIIMSGLCRLNYKAAYLLKASLRYFVMLSLLARLTA
jgi:hypothetical protein